MGAKISWKDVGVLVIEGVSKLKGTEYEINSDDLEVSGFAALAAATGSDLLLKNVDFHYLDAVLLQLTKMEVPFEKKEKNLLIKSNGSQFKAFRLQSGLYPKLMSDHLPPFAVLATQAVGTSMIHEWMYEGRLKYIEELAKMGAKTQILDPHRALITGPTALKGTNMISYDIRAGLTVVIAALVAEGETRISGAEIIDRGYEYFEHRLQKLGADIKRV
jgi:UDP-N-acetylglucosamine 1-carboxyvinyltransferase